MKARQVKVSTPDAFINKLEKMNRSAYLDPDICEITIGEIGKPHSNQLRPLGEIEHCRVHYLGNAIESPKDHDLPFYIVCVGRPSCPMCQVGDKIGESNTDTSKEKARAFWSTERNYWNVLPRWDDYDFGEGGARFLVLSFGTQARGTLEEVVTNFGHPGAVDDGFDLMYIAEEKKGFGRNYSFRANLETVKKGTRVAQELQLSPLTGEEGDYEMVDLTKYTAEPTADQFEKLQEALDIDNLLGGGKRHSNAVTTEDDEEEEPSAPSLKPRPTVRNPEPEIDEHDQESEDEKPFCFADVEVHDPSESGCRECNYFDDCAKEVKLQKINTRRNQ